MEIPEKIYLVSDDNNAFVFTKKRSDNKDVEYVRTDVFIKKAEDYFWDCLNEEQCQFGVSEWTELRADFESIEAFIRGFIHHIKGE